MLLRTNDVAYCQGGPSALNPCAMTLISLLAGGQSIKGLEPLFPRKRGHTTFIPSTASTLAAEFSFSAYLSPNLILVFNCFFFFFDTRLYHLLQSTPASVSYLAQL
jgi:hypothetical protein